MEYHSDPQLRTEVLQRLRDKYLTDKPLPHLTEVLYCLTRSYFDRFDRLEPTDKELIYFSVGFGLEEVMLRGCSYNPLEVEVSGVYECPECHVLVAGGLPHPTTNGPKSVEVDGLFMTPDYIALRGGQMDLKSTRMYPAEDMTPKRGWPETWLKQFMAYAYLEQIYGKSEDEIKTPFTYSVGVLYITPAELEVGTFIFTLEEILENQEWIEGRQREYMKFVVSGEVPTPFEYNQDWECQGCRFLPRCQALTGRTVSSGRGGRNIGS